MNHAPGDEKQASDFLNKSRLTREAMADVLANRVLDHQAVQQWADSLSTNTPLKMPGLSTLSFDHPRGNMNTTTSSESRRWIVTCQDATDGTGDLIVPLPADLLTEMGLADGDTLYIVEAYAGTHKGFVLSKTERIPDRVDELVEHFDQR